MHDAVPILRRSVGIHRAAQLLAEAYAWKHGQQPQPFKTLPPDERAWFLQTAEQMLGRFDETTTGVTVSAADRRAAERDAAVQIQRQISAVSASRLGHELSPWAPVAPASSYDEQATCLRCSRSVRITVQHQEYLEVFASGPALEEPCLRLEVCR